MIQYGRVTVPAETPLLERGTELDEITTAMDRAVAGLGSVLLIEGEAGIGKTRLLRAGQDHAAGAGATVLSGRGSLLEREFAFGVVRQLFQAPLAGMIEDERRQALSGAAAFAGSLLAVGEETGQSDPGPELFALLHGLHWLCANLAVTQPLMLGVDDVQWSDETSLRFLGYLAGRIEELPVIVVATLRSGEPDSPDRWLDELRAQEATAVLHPHKLSLDATVTIVRGSIDPAAEPGFCSACHESTGGNPLLLSELVRALELEGVEPVGAQIPRVSEIGASGVSERLLSRIDRLAPNARTVANAVAVLEPHATLGRLAAVAELDQHVTSAAAHALVEAGVLRDGSPLFFAHPLLRSAVERALTEPQRREHHAAAARVHHAHDSHPAIVAAHLLETDLAEGEWVVQELQAAAEHSLARGAPGPAVSFLRHAYESTPPGEGRAAAARALGSALLRAGDDEGIVWLTRVREASNDAVFRARIAEELGPSLLMRGRGEESAQQNQASIEELDGRDHELELELRAGVVRAALGGDDGAFFEPYDQLRSATEGAPESLAKRFGLQFLALGGVLGRTSAPEARLLAELALDDDEAVIAASKRGRPLGMAALSLGACGATDAALHANKLGLEEMRRRASVFGISSSLVNQACLRLCRGEIAEAEMDVAEASELAAEIPMVRMGAMGVRVAIGVERGQITEMSQLLSGAGLSGELPPPLFVGLLRVARGRLRLAQGRADEALSDFGIASDSFHGLGFWGPDFLPPRLHLALALLALGRSGEARERAASELAWAEEMDHPHLIGEALRVQGLVDQRAGLDALRDAVGQLAPTDFRLDYARALVDLGSALRRGKERKASRDPLREGMELAHRCGATALVEHARTELEATGARPRSVIVSGADSLTPSERRVAQLAANGMTNREIAQTLFVTAKTVETHLRHCYQKLEIAGRAELPAALNPTTA